jgi:hypothetical protein
MKLVDKQMLLAQNIHSRKRAKSARFFVDIDSFQYR